MGGYGSGRNYKDRKLTTDGLLSIGIKDLPVFPLPDIWLPLSNTTLPIHVKGQRQN